MEFYECNNVTVNGITLVNSPMWTMVSRYSSNINITNYHVQDYSDAAATIPASTGSNTDGFDPVGSSFITISNFTVQNGDDIIAIKSGLPKDVINGVQMPAGTDTNEIGLPEMPSHDITIANTTLAGGGNSGISIGSEASNGVYNVLLKNIKEVRNAQGVGTSVGLRIKTGRTRGNYAVGDHDITVENMSLDGTPQPIQLYGYYPASNGPNETGFTTQCTLTTTTNCIDPPQAIQVHTPNVYNITISDLTADRSDVTEHHCRRAGILHPECESQQREYHDEHCRRRWRPGYIPTAEHDRDLHQREPDLLALARHSSMGGAGERAGNRHGDPGPAITVNTPPQTTTPPGAVCGRYPIGTTP